MRLHLLRKDYRLAAVQVAELPQRLEGDLLQEVVVGLATEDVFVIVFLQAVLLAGLPEWVLRELKPDTIILVETDEDQILKRRLSDATRVRDIEGARAIADDQGFNRAVSAAYAPITGCTIKYLTNADFLIDRAVEEMMQTLR